MALFRRGTVHEVIRALQDELAGGPRAEVPSELQLVAHLIAVRDRRHEQRREPEREVLAAFPDAAGVVGADGRFRVANEALDRLAPGARALALAPLEVARSAEL